MRNEKVSREASTLAAIIPALFIDIVLVIISSFGLIYLLLTHKITNFLLISFIIILIVLLGIIGSIVWGLEKQNNLIRFVKRISEQLAKLLRKDINPHKLIHWLEVLFNAADYLMVHGWRGSLLGAAITTVSDMVSLYFVFVAAGNPVSFGQLLVGYCLPILFGKMAFMFPGGIGIVEATMVGLYTGLGVPNSVAVVIVLAYRLISFWIPLFLGFPILLILRKNKTSQ